MKNTPMLDLNVVISNILSSEAGDFCILFKDTPLRMSKGSFNERQIALQQIQKLLRTGKVRAEILLYVEGTLQ